MKRITLVILAAIAAPAVADPAQEVRCAEIGFSRSIEARDIQAFKSYIDTDARFVSESVSRGPEEITAAWSVFAAEDGPRLKWRPQIIEVLADGKLALSRGPYRYTARDDDGVENEFWGTFNSIWRLQADGSWKVVFDAGSPDTRPPTDDDRAILDGDDDCPG